MLFQSKKIISNITCSIKGVCVSLKCRLSMPEFYGYHAANEYNKTKD